MAPRASRYAPGDGGLVDIGVRPLFGEGFVGPYDDFSHLAACVGLRRLLSSYDGPLIRVREDGGDTEADIGFDTNGDLDTAALLAHCGATNGTITKWYDQTGTGGDLTYSGALDFQPQIVSAGVVNVDANGQPRLSWDVRGDSWSFNLGGASGYSFLALVETAETQWILHGGDSASEFCGVVEDGSAGASESNAGSPSYLASGSPIASPDRDDLGTAWSIGSKVVAEARAVDTTSWEKIIPLSYASAGYEMAGFVYEIAVFSATGSEGAALTAMDAYWDFM